MWMRFVHDLHEESKSWENSGVVGSRIVVPFFCWTLVHRSKRGGIVRWDLGALHSVLRNASPCRQGSRIMTSVAIFLLGLIVTLITGVGAVLIGLQEAGDPSQSRVEDLAQFEKQMVGRGEGNLSE